MKKYLVTLLHIGFWGCYIILGMVILGVLHGNDAVMDEAKIEQSFYVIMFFAFVPSMIAFYAFYLWLFPSFIMKKKYLNAACWGLVVSLIAGYFGYSMLTLIFGENCGVENTEDPAVGITLFIAFVASISGVIAWVIRGFITWFEEIKLKETLKQKNQEMELALVKAQLDPHFLFNTINNIDVLILKDADAASNYLNKLSDIMRFMLYETKPKEILLSKEIEYIEKYIALQKIRTANDSYVNFEIEGEPGKRKIAPMIFIPFIENAFKHTTNKKVDQAILIKIDITKDAVRMLCENKFGQSSAKKTESNGLGNGLINKRLELLYPDSHQLSISNKDNRYQVDLSIQNGEV